MHTMHNVTTKEDFGKFLTDDRMKIKYKDKVFTKNIKGNTFTIQQDKALICEVYKKKFGEIQ